MYIQKHESHEEEAIHNRTSENLFIYFFRV